MTTIFTVRRSDEDHIRRRFLLPRTAQRENDQAHELAVEVSETVSGHFISTAWPETDTSSKLVSGQYFAEMSSLPGVNCNRVARPLPAIVQLRNP